MCVFVCVTPQAHKWTHHVFFWILDHAIVNAHLLYCSYYKCDPKKYSQIRFRKRLLFQAKIRIEQEKRQSGVRRRCMLPFDAPTRNLTQVQQTLARAKAQFERLRAGEKVSTSRLPDIWGPQAFVNRVADIMQRNSLCGGTELMCSPAKFVSPAHVHTWFSYLGLHLLACRHEWLPPRC